MPTISAARLPEKPSAWVASIVRSIVVAPGDGDDTGGITRMSRVGWYDRPRAASTAGSGRHHRTERRQLVGGPDGDEDLAGHELGLRGRVAAEPALRVAHGEHERTGAVADVGVPPALAGAGRPLPPLDPGARTEAHTD